MFDWYTTMNQPDWDGRTYAFPQPTGVAPVQPLPQGNPMQRPQAINEMLPQGSVSGGLLGKLAEGGGEEQATPRMPSPFGPKQGQGGAAASPAPSPAPVQPPAPQANPLTAPASGPLAWPVMQPQMMPQQPMPMAASYGWGQPLPQMAGQGAASAQAGKTGEDKGVLGNFDPGALALFAGLSMLGNNTGGRTFGQLVGKAGFDALAGAGGMAAAQAAAERQKRQDAREDMATRIAQHKIDLERYKMAQEAAGMQILQGYLGGGAGAGMGGMMPSRPTLGGAYTGAALAPEVDGWIVKYSQEYGVDPNIVRAVVMQESGGRQDVVSPAGAIGYGQLMLDTAKGLGVDPYDPEQNIKGTVMYLGQMRDRYGGNWDRALYAYNWGPGNMDAYLQTGKGLDGQPMPSETLNYVPGVRGRLSGAQQPAVAGGYGGGGVPTIPLQALALPGAAGEAARAIFAAQQTQSQRDLKNALEQNRLEQNSPRGEFLRNEGKRASQYMADLQAEAKAAQDSISAYVAFEGILDRGLKTGLGQGALDDVARALDRMGIDTKALGLNNVRDIDTLRNLTTRAVMSALADQKGVQTEGDAQRAMQTWVSISNSPEANRWINTYQRNLAERRILRAEFIQEALWRSNGNIQEAEKAWKEYSRNLPSVVPPVPGTAQSPRAARTGLSEFDL
jgi:soluble lytic murein transglycosylase-like protein